MIFKRLSIIATIFISFNIILFVPVHSMGKALAKPTYQSLYSLLEAKYKINPCSIKGITQKSISPFVIIVETTDQCSEITLNDGQERLLALIHFKFGGYYN